MLFLICCEALPGIPIFGNLFQWDRKNMKVLIKQWHDKLGPIFRMRLINQKIVFMSKPEIYRQVLKPKFDNFDQSETFAKIIGTAFPNSVIVTTNIYFLFLIKKK